MTDADSESPTEHERGGILECGKCRVGLMWDPVSEVYECPECGWSK